MTLNKIFKNGINLNTEKGVVIAQLINETIHKDKKYISTEY